MRILEKILLCFLFLGVFFKVMHYPGASVLLVLSLGSLSMLYFGFSFLLLNKIRTRNAFKVASYNNVSGLRLLGSVFLGLLFSQALIGLLFRIQLYPGASVMLLTACFGLGIAIVILTIFAIIGRSGFTRDNVIRLVVITFFAFFFNQVSEIQVVKFYYQENAPDYVKAYENHLLNPEDKESERQLELERRKIYGHNRK